MHPDAVNSYLKRAVFTSLCKLTLREILRFRATRKIERSSSLGGRPFANLSAFVFLVGVSAFSSQAAIYTVTSTADTDVEGTLRWALTQANADPDSTIVFNDNLGTITLTSALPSINTAMTILGGTGNTVSGANAHRIFLINAASSAVNIQNLGLSNGYAEGGYGGYIPIHNYNGTGGGGLGAGGAIYVHAGALTLTGVALEENTARGGAGGESLHHTVAGNGVYGLSSGPSVGGYGQGGESEWDAPGNGGFGGGGAGGPHASGLGGMFGGNGGQGSSYWGWDPGATIHSAPGGGGAGLGGAIFVEGVRGASLTITDWTMDTGTVIGGAAGTNVYS